MYSIEGAEQRDVVSGDVRLRIYVADAPTSDGAAGAPPVVFSHGWPELAYSWRHQLRGLAGAGYTAIAPDQRGYGASDVPTELEAYDIVHLTGDLVAILDELGHDRAVFCGHDWGGLIVWQMPHLHPERTAGVIGVNTPAAPRTPMSLPKLFEAMGQTPEDNYILFFQEPGAAEARFEAEGAETLFRTFMRSGVPLEEVMREASSANPFREGFDSMSRLGRPLLDATDLEVYVEAFERTGFTGGLNYYRNMHRNWELTAGAADTPIEVPCLMVTAEWDPVLRPELAEPMKGFIDDLEVHQIAECGHWTQQEKPAELNEIVIDWLDRRFRN